MHLYFRPSKGHIVHKFGVLRKVETGGTSAAAAISKPAALGVAVASRKEEAESTGRPKPKKKNRRKVTATKVRDFSRIFSSILLSLICLLLLRLACLAGPMLYCRQFLIVSTIF